MLFLRSLHNLNQRRPALQPTYYVPVVNLGRLCPECAGPLTRASACMTCVYCGWSKCG